MKTLFFSLLAIVIIFGCQKARTDHSEDSTIVNSTKNSHSHHDNSAKRDTSSHPKDSNGKNGCVPHNSLNLNTNTNQFKFISFDDGEAKIEGIPVDTIHIHYNKDSSENIPGIILMDEKTKDLWNEKLRTTAVCTLFTDFSIGICDTKVEEVMIDDKKYFSVMDATLLCTTAAVASTIGNNDCAKK